MFTGPAAEHKLRQALSLSEKHFHFLLAVL